jgi:hypothetical protein
MAGCEAKCFRPLPNEELALLAPLAGLFFAVTACVPWPPQVEQPQPVAKAAEPLA